jgi:hypothetical protein
MHRSSNSIIKSENPSQYAKLANEGILLGYPVKIKGQETRGDNGINYHSTIKYFDKDKDHPHSIHEIARNLPLNPPDAKNTQIGFDKFKDRLGNDVHVITLHGNSANKLKEHNGKFAGMGFPSKFEWQPHISVDKAQWDKIKNSGAKTAHEAGIEFGNAHLKKGSKVLKTYHHEPDTTDPRVPDLGDMTAKATAKSENDVKLKPLMKPYVSEAQRRWAHTANGEKALGGKAHVHEWDESTKGKNLPEHVSKSDELEKGALKNAGIALGMAGALAGSSHPANTMADKGPQYDHQKMLRAISQVESSGGKNTHHKQLSNGEHAYGKWALTPNTIHDTIKMSPDLKTKHAKALALRGDTISRYLQDHKGLEDTIADRHLSHLEQHFGNNLNDLGVGWLNGVTGTKKAKKSGKDLSNHWYAKRIRDAYNKGK